MKYYRGNIFINGNFQKLFFGIFIKVEFQLTWRVTSRRPGRWAPIRTVNQVIWQNNPLSLPIFTFPSFQLSTRLRPISACICIVWLFLPAKLASSNVFISASAFTSALWICLIPACYLAGDFTLCLSFPPVCLSRICLLFLSSQSNLWGPIWWIGFIAYCLIRALLKAVQFAVLSARGRHRLDGGAEVWTSMLFHLPNKPCPAISWSLIRFWANHPPAYQFYHPPFHLQPSNQLSAVQQSTRTTCSRSLIRPQS